jgi:hypothetical protein
MLYRPIEDTLYLKYQKLLEYYINKKNIKSNKEYAQE